MTEISSNETAEARQCAACGSLVPVGDAHHCALLSVTEAGGTSSPTEPNPGRGDEDPKALLGQTLGDRYELVEIIGSGAMGVVFRARHIVLESDVAVKVLRGPSMLSTRDRFLREARVASQLHHPNIVYIFDYGLLHNRRPYLVMEMLPGRTLAEELTRGRMETLRAVRIAVQIARGLQAIHERGIVHRGR
jgi:serine/threonine protein kinase